MTFVDEIIYIDSSVRKPFVFFYPHSNQTNSHVVGNLVDPPPVKSIRRVEEYFESLKGRFLFCMAGMLSDHDKGTSFVVNAFINSGLWKKNAALVLIGKIGKTNFKKLTYNPQLSNSVIWIDEIENLSLSGAYSYVNAIVRGESSFNPGRSVYEALANNIYVLMPGSKEEVKKDQNLSRFAPLLCIYEPRDMQSLSTMMNEAFSKNTPSLSNNLTSTLYDQSNYARLITGIYR
ncbi:glycosyltransferase [Cyanobium sp. ATX 6E8]|uniref:hypothetical protein n=1 Tax=Cyanobium sp. ATX 6E8 TaxID=2823701 RepID=UPI0020CF73A1|nr:hypothetical protein [Cyanobium sp. ATX 6E8]MCP9941483.1 glycosyltransferase [Cyanobium sp. ATX 6E8]